jgi:hypothetical protein
LQETEFTEALGRLLTNGQLRDDFAVDPDRVISSLCQNTIVKSELVVLRIEELEAQAEVLLRKRFEVVKRILPQLICQLELKAWPLFRQYARNRWLSAPQDALEFADYAAVANSNNKIDPREMNLFRFALKSSPSAQFHWILFRNKYPALQVLIRTRHERWREIVLSLHF